MRTQFLLKSAGPMVAISLLLFVLAIAAARYVRELQKTHFELISGEVFSMLAADDLYIEMVEIRLTLNQYLRTMNPQILDKVEPRRRKTLELLGQAKQFARTDRERELLAVVEQGIVQFFAQFDSFKRNISSVDARAKVQVLIDQALALDVLTPAQDYVRFTRQIVERTNEMSQGASNWMALEFILLGSGGAIAGLAMGFTIADRVSRWIVNLDVSIRGAAGKLNEVMGPVTISGGPGFEDLQRGLGELEAHIGNVVERLQQREIEILKREQLASLGQLAAGMAHEIRNPLTPMKMLVAAAVERKDGAGLQGRHLLIVQEEIERLERSVRTFLEFAKPSPPTKVRVDLAPMIDMTVQLVQPRASEQGAIVEEDLGDAPLTVDADASQIRQALLNVLLNALDALPQGGRIEVTAGVLQRPEEEFSRLESQGGDGPTHPGDEGRLGESDQFREWCFIRVQDDGPGIDPAVIDRVFEPFVSTKETGNGLGLPICQRILEAHGGRIEAVNPPGGGAAFTLWIPCAATATPAESAVVS